MPPTEDEAHDAGRRRPRELLATVAGSAAIVICCAGPLLFTAGALGTVGAFLRENWLLVLAAIVLVAGAAWATWTRRHHIR